MNPVSQTLSERSSRNKRIEYIDLLRSIAIFLVIYGHVDVQLLWHDNSSKIAYFFSLIHMPLFFFISGYFMYSEEYTKQLVKKRIINRLVYQLYPTIIFFVLYVLTVIGKSPIDYLFTIYKAGYWFTFVSIEISLIILPLLYVFTRTSLCRQRRSTILFLLTIIAFLAYSCLKGINERNTHDICVLLSIGLVLKYIPFVLLGCLFRINKDLIINKYFIPSYWWITFSLFIVSVLIRNSVSNMLLGITSIAMLFYLSSKIPISFFDSNIGKILSFCGQRTLEIYLLHYFIIALLGRLKFVSFLSKYCGSLFEFPIYAAIAFFILTCCLFFYEALKYCKIDTFIFPKR